MDESKPVAAPTYILVCWVFLRGLGFVYVVAFASIFVQVLGLIGSTGILPADSFLKQAAMSGESVSFFNCPTVFWLNCSDLALRVVPALGVLFSLLIMDGVATGPLLFLSWLFYLSLVTVGGDFLSFQWDALLLEVGFLSIFYAPNKFIDLPIKANMIPARQPDSLSNPKSDSRPVIHESVPDTKSESMPEAKSQGISDTKSESMPDPKSQGISDTKSESIPEARSGATPAPSVVILWLLRLVLFKLMLLSGCVKLLSGDVTWHNLTALQYHYWTQPLPTPIAWFAAQLPDWFQKFSVACMFFIELLVPFFIFIPGKFRLIGAILIASLQVLILLTGNYTFFNLLTILLCVLLLDDSMLQRLMPKNFARSLIQVTYQKGASIFSKIGIVLLATTICLLNIGHCMPMAPAPIKHFTYILSPWCLANNYGLFAVMTTSRKEIQVEASLDGKKWQPYQFLYKPGDLQRAPGWVAPYQPRLDWQMWFAALGTRVDSPWFTHFVLRLLQGSPQVRALLKSEPFSGRPPKFVRASLYDYQFTDWNELTKSGAWWKRTYVGSFFPEASLRDTARGTESQDETRGIY